MSSSSNAIKGNSVTTSYAAKNAEYLNETMAVISSANLDHHDAMLPKLMERKPFKPLEPRLDTETST